MKTRILFQIALVLTFFYGSAVYAAPAAQKFYYDGPSAAAYARNAAWMTYGSGNNQNPFYNMSNNCANFVSQAILAGMIKKVNPRDVFNRRYDFAVDQTLTGSYRWFYLNGITDAGSGAAWRGANDMNRYAVANTSAYKGLHFNFVASDRANSRTLNPSSLREGDVVFCDWSDNGSINHVVMVARIDGNTSLPSYERIKIAAQSNPHVDTSLQWIINKSHVDDGGYPSFKVYRPTDYNQAGR